MRHVELNNVIKRYSDVIAVNEINLEIEEGEFVTFVGPSGCGKSTTLETIAGLTKPTSGKIRIAGRDVTNLPPKDRNIAMVFQNIALFPHMDVYDNVSFGLRLRNYPDDEVDEQVEDALRIVEMTGMNERMPDELSGGQRQRVAIARAIVRKPEVFLMDEPLANLDAKLRVHMRTELQRLHKELDTTIIYVTHDQAEAMTMSDRIAVIDGGELKQIAPPLTCYNEPANLFVAGFIGSPSMNFVEGEISSTGFVSSRFDVKFDVSTEDVTVGDAVTLGIRPEDVYLERSSQIPETRTRFFEMTTDVLEPMGDEIFVYLDRDDQESVDSNLRDQEQLLMSVDPDTELEADDSVRVAFDTSNIHLFDTNSGEAVTHELTR